MKRPIDFSRWVHENNPSENLEYRKGWWDYIELVQRLTDKHEIEQLRWWEPI